MGAGASAAPAERVAWHHAAASTVGLVLGLEWRRAARRRRLFVLNTVIPLVLVAPVALGAAPAQHAAAVYVVLFILFGTFGAAIPLLRDAERGLVRRFALTPIPPMVLLVGRALSNAALDVVQLAPSLAVIIAIGTPAHRPLMLPLVLFASLIFGNILGIWVAAIARSVAEGALFAAVTTLLLLHASGVFRTPLTGSVGQRIEDAAPFRALHESLLGQPGGGVALLVGVSVAIVLTATAAELLLRSLATTDGR